MRDVLVLVVHRAVGLDRDEVGVDEAPDAKPDLFDLGGQVVVHLKRFLSKKGFRAKFPEIGGEDGVGARLRARLNEPDGIRQARNLTLTPFCSGGGWRLGRARAKRLRPRCRRGRRPP